MKIIPPPGAVPGVPQNPRKTADSLLLGKNTKSGLRTPSEKLDARGLAKRHVREGIRYEMQDVARSIGIAAGVEQGLQYPANYHRVCQCNWQRRALCVSVAASGDRVKFGGLVICGSVWACPLCAAVIQEQRRKELVRAVAWAYHNGFQATMVTLTFPHQQDDGLSGLLERQALALRLFRKGRGWTRLKEFSRYQGHIRSLELTHGDHGWHPHTHELFFIAADVDEQRFVDEIREQWESACVRAGLLDLNKLWQVLAFRDFAVDVRFNCKDSDYIAKQDDSRKWGIDHEVAKASTKAGRNSGIHPHGFLIRAGSGDRRAAELFLEFLKAMHGKRQLVWSPRLKTLCGLDDVSDDQVVERVDLDEVLLCLIDPGNWSRVQRRKARRELIEHGEKALLSGGPPNAAAAIGVFLGSLEAKERRR